MFKNVLARTLPASTSCVSFRLDSTVLTNDMREKCQRSTCGSFGST